MCSDLKTLTASTASLWSRYVSILTNLVTSGDIHVQMPFSNDTRSFGFESLTRLFSKRGTKIENHPLLPTEEQVSAMEAFVDSMDLMRAEKTEEG